MTDVIAPFDNEWLSNEVRVSTSCMSTHQAVAQQWVTAPFYGVHSARLSMIICCVLTAHTPFSVQIRSPEHYAKNQHCTDSGSLLVV